MKITNEALQAIIKKAFDQGYDMGYIIGRGEKDEDPDDNLTWGDIYEEFKSIYPSFVSDVVDYRPYRQPYASGSNPFSILLYMKNGEKKRYSHVTRQLYPIHEDEGGSNE